MMEEDVCSLKVLSPGQILCLTHVSAFPEDAEVLRLHSKRKGIKTCSVLTKRSNDAAGISEKVGKFNSCCHRLQLGRLSATKTNDP